MVEIGIKGYQETTVTVANVATNVGSGKVQVFATPMMIALMEKAAALSIGPVRHERFIIDIDKFIAKATSK